MSAISDLTNVAIPTFTNTSPRATGPRSRDYIGPYEVFWTKLQPWLAEKGYTLRPRFRPGWKASWLTDTASSKSKIDCEDFQKWHHPQVMDAVRVRDGAFVMFKRAKQEEADMARFLSRPDIVADARNHCVEIYDILDIPGSKEEVLIVMPLLCQIRDKLEFETVGEVVDFFRQIIEGMHFMHRYNIAYMDCKEDNILADAGGLYDERPHPLLLETSYDGKRDIKQRYSTTKKPIRYYYIDFDISKRYTSRTGNTEPSPWSAGIYDVPEFRDAPPDTPTDPFPVDIYMLGATIRRNYLEGLVMDNTIMISPRHNLEWMEGLVQDMMAEDPARRPKIEEVAERFDALISTLGVWKLRAPANRAKDKWSMRRKVRHWATQVSRVACFIPAIPRPQR